MAAIRKDAKPKVCTKAQFEAVLVSILSGMATHKAITLNKVDSERFYAMISCNEEMAFKYTRAKAASLDRMADQIEAMQDEKPPMVASQFDDHVDQGHVAWTRLRTENLKWLLAKMAPRKWGDKVIQEHTGADGGPIETRVVQTDYLTLKGALKAPIEAE